MPVYEYECLKCRERFEMRRSMNDSDKEIKCPKCNAENPRRIFSVFATTSVGSCTPTGPT